MAVHNSEIAAIFKRYASLLEIEGANVFRVRAYRNASRVIENLGQSVAAMVSANEDLSALPGIGDDLAGKIREIVTTGRLSALDETAKRTPGDLALLTTLPGLGPKRVKALHDKLGIADLKDLRAAIEKHRVRKLSGFGAKLEQSLSTEIERLEKTQKRFRLIDAEDIGEPLLEHLGKVGGVAQEIIAGSYRRRRDTVGDLDILVAAETNAEVMDRFVGYDEVDEVVSRGETRSTVRLRSGMQVDLRVVPDKSYGAALMYFTGSKDHNIAVRRMAVDRGLKLNEYGVFKGKTMVAGRTEAEVYAQVDLPYIEPELRENRGEIEAARKNRLPELISLDDIRGDLHVHTSETDGRNTVEEMARAAKDRGYAYIAITDHSRRVTVAHGMDAARLGKQIDEIDRVNERLKGIRVLKGVEVDILEDGSLDMPDRVLKELDLAVAAIHSAFDLPADKQTERVIRAMDNPYVSIFAHPTGRLMGEREPYAIDMERLVDAALERGCFLELNAQPERMDLNDVDCRIAKDAGLRVAIATDAHTTANLDLMRFGVGQARRGWLEPDDVINTRNWSELKKLLKRG